MVGFFLWLRRRDRVFCFCYFFFAILLVGSSVIQPPSVSGHFDYPSLIGIRNGGGSVVGFFLWLRWRDRVLFLLILFRNGDFHFGFGGVLVGWNVLDRWIFGNKEKISLVAGILISLHLSDKRLIFFPFFGRLGRAGKKILMAFFLTLKFVCFFYIFCEYSFFSKTKKGIRCFSLLLLRFFFIFKMKKKMLSFRLLVSTHSSCFFFVEQQEKNVRRKRGWKEE